MFIEELRHVRKKWKVPAMVLIVLLVLGLLSSFAYLGSSYGNVGSNTDSGDTYKSTAKSAAKAVKDKESADNLLAAVTAYDDYAAYQVLYLDDNGAKESYAKELDYVDRLLKLYGSQETTDAEWVKAYTAAIGANIAVGDTDKARSLFKESLSAMTVSSDYLSQYTQTMMGKELYSELSEDLNAAIAVLQPLADAYEEENPSADKEETTDETTAETPVTVLETANSNLQYAQMMASMYTTDTTTTTK